MLYSIPPVAIIAVMVLLLVLCVVYAVYVSFKYEHDFPAELEG